MPTSAQVEAAASAAKSTKKSQSTRKKNQSAAKAHKKNAKKWKKAEKNALIKQVTSPENLYKLYRQRILEGMM